MNDSAKRLRQTLAATLLVALGTGCSPKAADEAQDGAVVDRDGGVVDGDGGSADGGDDGSDGDGSDGSTGATGSAPALDAVLFRQVGRFGDDVRVDVTGHDADGDATSLKLRFLDEAGDEVALFDSDGDGTLDSGSTLVALDAALGTADGSGSFALFPGFHTDFPALHQVVAQVVDEAGKASEERMSALGAQPELALDDRCDPAFLENRCAVGLGCKGSPLTACAEGEAPTLTRAGYYSDEIGRRVLIEGTDPDGDASAFTVAFLDGAGQPVMLDLDGDGTVDATSFRTEVGVGRGGTGFFFSFEPSEQFIESVAKVSVTVHDRADLDSASQTLVRTASPVRSTSSTCDARGFDRCGVGSVCSPGVVDKPNRCTSVTFARQTACTGGTELTLDGAGASMRGQIGTFSLWDAPEGCSVNDPVRRPDGIVKLVLAKSAAKLVISTDNDYTNFDTTLYLLGGCNDEPVTLWCADDQSVGARVQLAVLELTDVPAGEYFVVVDSFPSAVGGTRFQLDARVE